MIIVKGLFLLPLGSCLVLMWLVKLATKFFFSRLSCLIVLFTQLNITQDLISLCDLFEPLVIFFRGLDLCVRVVPFGQLVVFLFNFIRSAFCIGQSQSRVVVAFFLEFCRKKPSSHLIIEQILAKILIYLKFYC